MTMDPLVGSVVLDRYEIVRRIGSGGMGSVYIGRQKAVQRDVALKILRSDLMTNEHVKERFRREAEIIGKLRHPNTIQLIDYGETPEGLAIMVMELLVGTPLNERLKEKGPLPLGDAITVGMEIAQSLAEAHLLGMVHRDLKPANIFLVEVAGQTHVKVLDFGIARILDEEATRLTSTGQVFGTPRYMSPEQALSTGEVDSRSDLYALGLIIYECIVGQPPFVAQTSIQYLSAHSTMTPPKLRDHFAEAPEVLENLIDACLSKTAEERPQTAAEVANHLAAIRRQIDAGGAMQPIDLKLPPSSRSLSKAVPTEPPAKSAATQPAQDLANNPPTSTAIVGGGRTTEVHDPTLIKPVRPPDLGLRAGQAGPKQPVMLFAGIGLVAVAALVGGGIWYMNREPDIAPLAHDAGTRTVVAMNDAPDAAQQIVEVVSPPDAATAVVEEIADAGEVVAESVDAGRVRGQNNKTKNGGGKSKRVDHQNEVFNERGEGVTTGPSHMTIQGEAADSLTAIAKKCTGSETAKDGPSKLTLKKCPAGCTVIVDEKCAGKTPMQEIAFQRGLHNVAVVCKGKVRLDKQQAFEPESVTELTCK